MKTKFDVINFHLTNKCNYSCIYCFAKFGKGIELSLEDIKEVIDNIGKYFEANHILGRVNLVGGEPLLVPFLDEIIDYILSKNIKVSIVTNASKLTSTMIVSYKNRVDTIGISIDSLVESTNKRIGRACNNNVVTKDQLEKLAKMIKQCGIKLKINTVISKYNNNESLNSLYDLLDPARIKVFQMLVIEGVNDSVKEKQLTDQEFEDYCSTLSNPAIVKESSQEMINSYVIINPFGKMVTDKNGYYEEIGDCISEDFERLLDKNCIESEKFSRRYAVED